MEKSTDPPVVTAVCERCGRMQIDKEYYQVEGNAATHFIVCKSCQKKQKKK